MAQCSKIALIRAKKLNNLLALYRITDRLAKCLPCGRVTIITVTSCNIHELCQRFTAVYRYKASALNTSSLGQAEVKGACFQIVSTTNIRWRHCDGFFCVILDSFTMMLLTHSDS